MIDGPVEYVCSVDRDTTYYATGDELNRGDKLTRPDFCCEKFKMDPRLSRTEVLGLYSKAIASLVRLDNTHVCGPTLRS